MAPKKKDEDFRRRRLSVTDKVGELSVTDESSASPAPGAGGRRQRRMSMSPEMGVVKPRALLPFPPEFVGTYSCHGVEPGLRAGETSAKINQDRGCVCYPFGETHPDRKEGQLMSLFCVFDGHGAMGDKVSHYAMNNIQELLEMHPDLVKNPKKALKETFVKVDTNLKADPSIDAELSGTTAVVILMKVDDDGKTRLYCANAGDSRGVIAVEKDVKGKKKVVAVDLTEDQKPDTKAEQDRITKKGGFVSPPEEEWGGPARVWLDQNMTLPGLAMGRSIGDHLVTSIGVIAEPEVTIFEITPTHKFMVMASDGVWEFISSQDAIDILADQMLKEQATNGCTRLIETAAARWRKEEGDYRDDITALCVNLSTGAVFDLFLKDGALYK